MRPARAQAAYIRVPQSARREMAERGLPFREGLHAASHALINVVPLFLLCNATDLGSECDNPYDTRFRPERLLIFDKHPGGIGLAKQVAASPVLRRKQSTCTDPPCICSASGKQTRSLQSDSPALPWSTYLGVTGLHAQYEPGQAGAGDGRHHASEQCAGLCCSLTTL